MTGAEILIDTLAGRMAAARLENGVLDDLLIDPSDSRPRPGAIFRARVGRPMKGQGGRIVEMPGRTGFLRQGGGLSQGTPVLVQVTGFAEAGKAVPVTAQILFKSRYCIATPDRPGINLSRAIRDEAARLALRDEIADLPVPAGMGLILRSAAARAPAENLRADIEDTLAIARQVAADRSGAPELLLDGPEPDRLAWRDWSDVPSHAVRRDPGCFAASGVLDAVAALADPHVGLAGGGAMYVEAARALVAVDVNTGADTTMAAGLKTNMDAARALPRALRLRGLAGQIVVDFAPMPKKDRRRFEGVLRSAFRACPVETNLVGWTPLGHFEMTRKRERLPLSEALG